MRAWRLVVGFVRRATSWLILGIAIDPDESEDDREMRDVAKMFKLNVPPVNSGPFIQDMEVIDYRAGAVQREDGVWDHTITMSLRAKGNWRESDGEGLPLGGNFEFPNESEYDYANFD